MPVSGTTISEIGHELPGIDPESIRRSMANILEYRVGKDTYTATQRDWFLVVAYLVRDRMMAQWMRTMRSYYRDDAKRVYYLSMEFLIGRSLYNSLYNLGIYEPVKQALADLGLDLEEIAAMEPEAALGNGGLGRLAACFLDSMATLRLAGYGYGIRYEYGMFRQSIEGGEQVEHPDNWLRYGNPWEFPRPEVIYPVRFNGRVVAYDDEHGRTVQHWVDTDEVIAMAYDMPIPGFRSGTAANLRLWSAKSSRDFDLGYFNEGNYIKAIEAEVRSENISRVLYPDDTTWMGKELRLRQQYFFVCASLQDILYRYQKYHDTFDELPHKVAIQLNDTHPAIAIPELMRVLVDIHGYQWDRAWRIVTGTFAYTNHTLMPEALETWPVELLGKVLPRHLQIIYEINHAFLRDVAHSRPGDVELLRRMSIIDERHGRSVRMAHLAVVGSHRVNGVAHLHTELMKSAVFSDFDRLYPEKFINRTNGVTPRRWLHHINPRLAALISDRIGSGWVTNLERLRGLEPFADDGRFREEFRAIKQHNKERLARMIARNLGIDVRIDSIFDVQVKRIHEYKRQLLNVLHIITLYNRVRRGAEDEVPRTFILSGKAAPGYTMAKLVIRLINGVADVVNNDPATGDRLRVVFIPNYDVSTASDIIPAADVSEQISTAGTEASGTGNMKLALNGALTVGTLDGANVEIRDAVGGENLFIFGLTVEEVAAPRGAYTPRVVYEQNPALREVIDMIGGGFFSPEGPEGLFRPLVDNLLEEDRYLVLADYAGYVECQREVAELYRAPEAWTRKAILNVARMGRFSSDRAVAEYARDIWRAEPVRYDPVAD